MKLLVLGTSDSDGSTLPVRELAWPWLAGAGISASGIPCETVHRRFYATATGSDAYLDRQLAANEPDIVVLSATLYAFSVKTVGGRIRRLAGERAQRWAERRFNWFDRGTAHVASEPTPSVRARTAMNRAAHWTARTFVGTESEASLREVYEGYAMAVDRLSREEDVAVIVIGSLPFTAAVEAQNARVRTAQARFNEALQRRCAERRVGWVDPEFLRDADVEALYDDALHLTAAAHERVAAQVLAALPR